MSTMPIGYFGKLPSLGDFATRRLPFSFVQPWDDWLQGALSASRDQLGGDWLETYLASPFWRFVLAPGVCGPEPWMGVLMPSMDRVGRPFPLTLAQPARPGSGVFELMLCSDAWFVAVENLMLSALHAELSLDWLDRQLLALPEVDMPARPAPSLPIHTPWRIGRPPSDAGAKPLSPLLDGLARCSTAAWSCWSTTGSALAPASLLVCNGLPPEHAFAALLDGAWHGTDWTNPTPPEEPAS